MLCELRFTLIHLSALRTLTAYSQAKFAVDRVLTPEEYAQVQRLSEQIRALSADVGFEEDAPPDDVPPPNVDPETGEVIEPLA